MKLRILKCVPTTMQNCKKCMLVQCFGCSAGTSAWNAKIVIVNLVSEVMEFALHAKMIHCQILYKEAVHMADAPKMMHQMKKIQVIKKYLCGLWLLLLLDACQLWLRSFQSLFTALHTKRKSWSKLIIIRWFFF